MTPSMPVTERDETVAADEFRTWVPTPQRFRRTLTLVALAFVAFVLGALFLPWRQNIRGKGRVIAYAPLDRQQAVEAPFDGRLLRWHVQEGSHVESGDLLADVVDLDPDLMSRLQLERDVMTERLASYRERVATLRDRIGSVERTQKGAIVSSEARVRVATDRRVATDQAIAGVQAELEAARTNADRHRDLVAQGLVSQRELELAVAVEARALANLDVARAQASAAVAEVASAQASLEQARAHAQAEIESASAALNTAQTDVQGAQGALLRIESRLARQHNQHIRAPRSGTVLRILANEGGEQVKSGDPLALLVPDTLDRAAEIYVDGNDAALIQPGRSVRVQFEGWPAVQFVGWPSVAVGTFAGRVAFVDSHDDGYGNFRVVVSPESKDAWPSVQYLRQGTRANGWVLLDEVRIGYELWRVFNGFPQSIAPPTRDATASTKQAKSNKGGSEKGDDDATY